MTSEVNTGGLTNWSFEMRRLAGWLRANWMLDAADGCETVADRLIDAAEEIQRLRGIVDVHAPKTRDGHIPMPGDEIWAIERDVEDRSYVVGPYVVSAFGDENRVFVKWAGDDDDARWVYDLFDCFLTQEAAERY